MRSTIVRANSSTLRSRYQRQPALQAVRRAVVVRAMNDLVDKTSDVRAAVLAQVRLSGQRRQIEPFFAVRDERMEVAGKRLVELNERELRSALGIVAQRLGYVMTQKRKGRS